MQRKKDCAELFSEHVRFSLNLFFLYMYDFLICRKREEKNDEIPYSSNATLIWHKKKSKDESIFFSQTKHIMFLHTNNGSSGKKGVSLIVLQR